MWYSFFNISWYIDDSCEFFYIILNCAHKPHKLYLIARFHTIPMPIKLPDIANDEVNDWFRYLHIKNSCFLIVVSFFFLFCNLKTNMLHLTAEFTNAIYASVNSSCVQSPSPPQPGWPLDMSIFLALDGKFPWRWGLLSSAGIDWCIVISFRKRVLWTALYPDSFDLLLMITGITGVLWENNILITVTQPLRRAKLRLNPCYAMQGSSSPWQYGRVL